MKQNNELDRWWSMSSVQWGDEGNLTNLVLDTWTLVVLDQISVDNQNLTKLPKHPVTSGSCLQWEWIHSSFILESNDFAEDPGFYWFGSEWEWWKRETGVNALIRPRQRDERASGMLVTLIMTATGGEDTMTDSSTGNEKRSQSPFWPVSK